MESVCFWFYFVIHFLFKKPDILQQLWHDLMNFHPPMKLLETGCQDFTDKENKLYHNCL